MLLFALRQPTNKLRITFMRRNNDLSYPRIQANPRRQRTYQRLAKKESQKNTAWNPNPKNLTPKTQCYFVASDDS